MSDNPREDRAKDPSPEEKRELASYIRHELRTPLNQIIGYSQMLKEEAEEDGLESFEDDLGRIEAAGTRLLGLIDSLLDPEALQRAGIHRVEPLGGAEDEIIRDDGGIELPAPADVSGSILVVDDNEANRDMLARRLTKRGYDTTTAEGGREAIRLIEEHEFDLVLLDVMMPEVNGLEVLDHVRKSHSVADLPIIMATAKNASDDIVEALHAGANDYVTKPLDFNVVVARVETQLSLKRANDKIRQLFSELEEAQSRIAKLMSSGAQALEDIPTWASKVSAELASILGVDEVGVWILTQGDMKATGKTRTSVPQMKALVSAAAAHSFVSDENQICVPASGMSGTVLGAVVVPKRDLSDPEERMIASFAHQFGGALELHKTRNELAAAEARAERRRQELIDQGIDLLHICPRCGSCYDQSTSHCSKEGKAVEPFRLLPYRILGRYRIVRILGQGGMGTVFAARDERLDRDVAVKVINAEHFRNPEVRQRFDQEARALAKIDHSGVLSIHDSGALEDGSGFLVMEMLHGADPSNDINKHGPRAALPVATLRRQGAAALAAAHKVDLVHRDIKPANLYMIPTARSFRLKILDFGIAKPIDLETHLTRTGSFIGTPAYMPPEQMSGLPVDSRSDLYSFAASVYEALTGRRITLQKDLANILMDIALNEPPPLYEIVPSLDPEIDAVMRQGLVKKRDDRPQDIELWAGELADLLEQVDSENEGWPMNPEEAAPSQSRDGTVVPVTEIESEAPTRGPVPDDTPAGTPEAPTTVDRDAPTTPVSSDQQPTIRPSQTDAVTTPRPPEEDIPTIAGENDTPTLRPEDLVTKPQHDDATAIDTPDDATVIDPPDK